MHFTRTETNNLHKKHEKTKFGYFFVEKKKKNMNIYKKIQLGIVFFIISFQVQAQFYNLGNPLITNFLPGDYAASSQNWDIVQDQRGMMYFGNTTCLLEYDGTNWNKLELPSSSVVRALDIDKNGTLFIGGVGQLGYLACNKLGENQYISLKDLLPEEEKEFQNIWRVFCVTDGVYFFSQDKIYIYDYEEFTVIPVAMEAFFGFKAYDKIFVLKKDNGLWIFDNYELIELPNTQIFNSIYRMYNILEYFDNKILIASRSNGLFTYDLSLFYENNKFNFRKKNIPETVLTKLNSNVTDYLATNSLYSSSKINDNLFAFGTVAGGIVLTDNQGDIVRIVNTNRGLNNNCIYSLYTDKFGNLWAGLQQGISQIDINYPLSYFNEEYNDLTGFVVSSIMFKGELYIATMVGLYKIPDYKPANFDDDLNVIKINTEITEFWDFYKDENILLTSGGKGISQIINNSLKTLVDGRIQKIHKLKLQDELFLLNKDEKIQIFKLDKSDSTNLKMSFITEFEDLNFTITDVIEDEKGSIWISSTYDGVYHITFKNNDISDYHIEKYGIEDGFPTEENLKVHFIDNKILFATKKGIYKAIKSGEKYTFEHDPELGDFLTKDSSSIGQIFNYKNGYLISSEISKVGIYKKINDKFEWNNKISKRFPINYKINFLNDNEISIYTSDGIYIFNLDKFKEDSTTFNCLIRNVKLKNDSILFSGNFYENDNSDSIFSKFTTIQPQNFVNQLDYENNSIIFEFSALFFESSEFNRYSYFLEGFDEDWSSLTFENKAVYTNIPEGDYTFKVKAINVYSDESTIAEYKFSISPPWYRTILAYIIYAILAILLVLTIIKIQTRRLMQQNLELERIVKERTAEVVKQKEEIEAQAKELEKLSIVASETDNAVVIADAHGNIEWINHGYTRLYGYSFEEMIANVGSNLIAASSNPEIKELLKNCVSEKTSVIYESKTLTKDGITGWAQTTITPIIDKNGVVTKLIAIDSDISKMKQAEQEILQKNEEIMLQKEMLEQQNEEITTQRDELEIQNVKIAFQNEQIKASINYAKTIQSAILPTSENIAKNFDHFILYRPKDIVSGDFFWYSCNKSENSEYHFIAAVDCTGHGVPGAFMSMISFRLISELINENKIYSPKEILTQLDQNVRKALKQDKTFNQDGMDMCFCRIEQIDNENFEIVFTGAKRTLYYYSTNSKSIESVKSDRKSIGGTNLRYDRVQFTNNHLKLNKNDILYLSTDGFIDQNNYDRRKIGTTKFLNLLENTSEKPLKEQKKDLENFLDNWQTNTEQRDDITIIGLKL